MKIDTSKWGKFKVGELFEVKRGQRHVVANHEEGNIPYYSASVDNNGVTDYIANPLFIVNNSIVVTTFGDAFWGYGNFTASDECTILSHCKLNELTGTYIATAYMVENKEKYSFKLKAFSGRVSEDIVKLPITFDGAPDWQYMENYMKNIMDEQAETVDALKKMFG